MNKKLAEKQSEHEATVRKMIEEHMATVTELKYLSMVVMAVVALFVLRVIICK